jgi:hypothetical protein
MATPSEADKDFALIILNRIDGPDDLVETLSEETGGYVFAARGRTAQFWPTNPSIDTHWQAYQALLDMADIAFYARPDDKWSDVTPWELVGHGSIFLNRRTGAVEVRRLDGEVLAHEDGPEDYYPGSVSERDLCWPVFHKVRQTGALWNEEEAP